MSDSPVFLDSNICLYLLSTDSAKKHTAEILLALPHTIISTQVISETINVGIKKFQLSHEQLTAHIDFLTLSCEVILVSAELQKKAMDIHFRYQLSFFDSLIIASALEANCLTLYTEDMQHKQVIENKLTLVNPFLSSVGSISHL